MASGSTAVTGHEGHLGKGESLSQLAPELASQADSVPIWGGGGLRDVCEGA
jgi:hypothetical protein